MGTYEDVDWKWLRALTRARRKQQRDGKLPSWVYNPAICRPLYGKPLPETIRASGETLEFRAQVTSPPVGKVRRRASYRSWRTDQWSRGNRRCHYCGVKMRLPPRKPRGIFVCTAITATVDHKTPLGRGGDDAPHNWVMCCSACNNRKGAMTEAEFRSLMASEVAKRAA